MLVAWLHVCVYVSIPYGWVMIDYIRVYVRFMSMVSFKSVNAEHSKCSHTLALSLSSFLSANKHKPWIETEYQGIVMENDNTVLLNPPLFALDKDAPLHYAGNAYKHRDTRQQELIVLSHPLTVKHQLCNLYA